LSAILLRETVAKHRWAVLAFGFVGVLIMVAPDLSMLNLRGTVLGLCGALGAAGAMIAIRTIGRTERSSTIVFYFTILGLAVGGISLLFNWRPLSQETLFALAVTGLLGGVGQLLLTGAIRRAPIGVVAPFEYAQLIWAAVISFIVWQVPPSVTALLGSALIAACGGYILMRESRTRAAQS